MTAETEELERRDCSLLQLVNHALALPSPSPEEYVGVIKHMLGSYIFNMEKDRIIKV